MKKWLTTRLYSQTVDLSSIGHPCQCEYFLFTDEGEDGRNAPVALLYNALGWLRRFFGPPSRQSLAPLPAIPHPQREDPCWRARKHEPTLPTSTSRPPERLK